MDPMTILAIAERSFALYMQIRASAKAAGITDQQLDAIEADYVAREATRAAEAHPPTP